MQTSTKVVKVWLGGCTLQALVGDVFPTFSFGLGLARSDPSQCCARSGKSNAVSALGWHCSLSGTPLSREARLKPVWSLKKSDMYLKYFSSSFYLRSQEINAQKLPG